MASIGERATLPILRETKSGMFLDSEGELGELLLPGKEIPASKKQWKIGDSVEVFIYCDSEDRPIATTRTPLAEPGEFAVLNCIATTGFGAFLDWGLPKDLFVPLREQSQRMQVGERYVVHVHVDHASDRILASSRLARHLEKSHPSFLIGQEVDLLVFAQTDLGYKAIIDSTHAGLIFANEVFRPLKPGDQCKGYISQVRSDGKIDITLNPPGRKRIDQLEERILNELQERGGHWTLCDKSSPEAIKTALGVSKKAFKQATGALFKKQKISIGKDGIRLIE
ncbi:GntR family transcriptional regulator [Verrucomicrobiaceae bacterium N1E253]|uniref:GntR family transcriptional regulator n=1 Tax=Oceaniferula marina TaxID=2748318 RepID=A0A851GDF0_9BACT|nr:S1-like domain-containing RNA-binding protein [Oceaniferula marina]NWK55583.1 GntR family transcriptional regulator [Oceaniferula marina]